MLRLISHDKATHTYTVLDTNNFYVYKLPFKSVMNSLLNGVVIDGISGITNVVFTGDESTLSINVQSCIIPNTLYKRFDEFYLHCYQYACRQNRLCVKRKDVLLVRFQKYFAQLQIEGANLLYYESMPDSEFMASVTEQEDERYRSLIYKV